MIKRFSLNRGVLLLGLMLAAISVRGQSTGLTARVEFSRPSGVFTGSVAVTLASPVPGAAILYTLDGAVPTNGSPVYSGPLTFTDTARLRAALFLTNSLGPVKSAYYVKLGADVQNFTSPLPIVVLENFAAGPVPQDIGTGPNRDGSFVNEVPYQQVFWAIFDRGSNGAASFSTPLDQTRRAGLRVRGSSSINHPRKAYSVETWDELNADDDATPLGLPAESDWVLYAPTPDFDFPLIHNSFIFEVARQSGNDAARTRFVELFINTGGGELGLADYAGLYVLMEKVKRDKARVDFDPLSPDGLAGGWMINVDRMDPRPLENPGAIPRHFHTAGADRILQTEDDNVRGYQGPGGGSGLAPPRDDLPEFYHSFFNFDEPGGYEVNPAQRAVIQDFVRQVDATVFGANFADPVTGYAALIDVDNWVDHYLLHNLAHNQDAFVLSTWLYRVTPEGKLRHGPIWDFDRAFNKNPTNTDPTRNLRWAGTRMWFGRLFSDANFHQRYIDRWQALRRGPLTTTNLLAIIDRQTNEITGPVAVRHGLADWPARVGAMKNWLVSRVNAIDAQYLAPPVFSHPGGPVPDGFGVAIAATIGQIYFTTDGSDPRAHGGAVAATAQNYTLPIGVTGSTQIRARVKNGASWSGLTEAFFLPPQDLSRLVVTEIMYHPPDAGAVDGDEFEFLELKNTGPAPLSIGGLTFTAGINYTFPAGAMLGPGQFWVLARNSAQFAVRHPGVTLHGIYTGKLDNAGESLTLSFSGGGRLFSVNYKDGLPWPLSPDGHGFSLVPKKSNPLGNSDNGFDYRASTHPGGSPGADDPLPVLAPVAINELLANSDPPAVDALELFNPAATDVDVGGWFLSDDLAAPRKFRLPQGTLIPAGGYVSFDETDFNPAPGASNSFSFSSRGEAVYLFSGDGTNLTGYSHGFEFGASATGVSFGRYITSAGEEDFPPQTLGSLGALNAGPSLGPVIISEVHYHPESDDVEFVELANNSGAAVPLFDPAFPTNTWRLRGVDYTFPPGVTLDAGAFALLVGTNPAAFIEKYAVPGGVLVLGPFNGQLQDSGERLELQRPDAPDTNGVGFITIDVVRYNDKLPWPPAADGGGASLQRRVLDAYGNDPVNWEAAQPSPGSALPAGQSPVVTRQPTNVAALAGQAVSFSIAATGAPLLNYQWRFEGTVLPGATNATLTLTNVQFSEAGRYDALVFNAAGSALTMPALLTIATPATILAQPQSVAVRGSTNAATYGEAFTNVVFAVGAFSTRPLSYQWQFNEVDIPGATNVMLTVSNVTLAHDGAYRALVSDSAGTIASAHAQLTVLMDPRVVQAPLAQSVVQGGTAVFSVELAGNPLPFTNEWRKGSLGVATNTVFHRHDFFALTNLTPGQAGTYRLVVRNAARPLGILAGQWSLTVLADTDADGLPDDWESGFDLDAGNVADAALDPDGDGVANLDEYRAGTNPTNASSYLKVELRGVLSGTAVLEFFAASNLTYTVEYRDTFPAGAWTRFADVIARATNRVEVLVDPAASPQRFYRLVTPRQP